jgi:hypothetical protein
MNLLVLTYTYLKLLVLVFELVAGVHVVERVVKHLKSI